MVDIRVLGTLEIRRSDGTPVTGLTQPKRLALLLYLLLSEPPGPRSRDSLMALLWPEADDESARHSLRNALYGLRQALGEGAFLARGEGYVALDPGAIRCDALEVRRLLGDERWDDAVARWGGELLPGFHVSGATEFEHWLDGERAALRRRVAHAAWRRVDELEPAGGPGLVAAAEQAWWMDPADEAGAQRLMRYLDASVGRAAALRVYADLSDYLARELEAEPSAETRALAEEIRARSEPHAPVEPLRPVPVRPEAVPRPPPSGSAGPARRRRGALALAAAGLVSAIVLGLTLRAAGSSGIARTAAAFPGDSVLRLPERWRRDTSAYTSYVRGLSLRFTAPLAVSRDTFAALVEREPLYAPGLAGLAHAYALATIYGDIPPAEGWPKVESAARRALALDRAMASAWLALGAREMFWRWNLPEARRLLDRGIALEPADPEAHAILGSWYRWQGEIDSAVAEARVSARLDPLNARWTWRLARQLFLARHYTEAEALYRQSMRERAERAPAAYAGLAELYRFTDRTREAVAMARAAALAVGDSAAAARVPVPTDEAAASRWLADRARNSLRVLLDTISPGSWGRANLLAQGYAAVGDADNTMRWLDSMLAWRDPTLVVVPLHPAFDFLRSDSRYQAWQARLPWRSAGKPGPDVLHFDRPK